MSFIILVIGGLVTWRLSNILVKEKGPLVIFLRLRAYLAAKQKHMGGFYDMISCVKCVSVFVGALVAIAPAESLIQWIGYTLAFSAVTAIIERLTSPEA